MSARTLTAVVLVLLWSCSPTSSLPNGGDYGLPPAGDAGQVLTLGEWELDATEDPEGTALVAAFARAYRGQSADFSGDGEVDLVVQREADGTLIRRYERYSAFRPTWVSHRFPDGRSALTMDLDGRGFDNVSIENDPAQARRVELLDLDFSSRYERRRTLVFDNANQTVQVIEERDAQENGTWVEAARFTLSQAQNQGTCAPGQGLSNFPISPFGSPDLVGGGASNVSIVTDGDVACTAAQRKSVRKAVRCALKRIDCLDRSSARLAGQVRAALSDEQLLIGCNNACPAADATTQAPGFGFVSAGRMNLRKDFETLPEETQCAVVLHELGHFAKADMDSTHENGVDRVYACGRYCSKCVKRGPASPTDMQDCVACAESTAERRACGTKELLQDMPCPTDNYCHAGLTGNWACETCKGKVTADCADQPLGSGPAFLCCAMCPVMYPTNDVPCGTPSLANGCNRQPPECP